MNAMDSIFHYDIVGEITVNSLSYDPTSTTLMVTEEVEQLFYGKVAPTIQPGSTAFLVRVANMSNGFPVDGFVAIVKNILRYKVTNENGTKSVILEFSFTRANHSFYAPNVLDVPMVIKDVIPCGDLIAIVFAGTDNGDVSIYDKYRTFSHGGVLYHSYSVDRLIYTSAADGHRVPVATVIYASRTELPSEDGKKEINELINKLYLDRLK